MNATPGEWIVVPAMQTCTVGTFLHKVIAVGPDGNRLVALVPDLADAAAIAAMPITLNALIQIGMKINASKNVIDIEELNEIISLPIEKIAAESGES